MKNLKVFFGMVLKNADATTPTSQTMCNRILTALIQSLSESQIRTLESLLPPGIPLPPKSKIDGADKLLGVLERDLSKFQSIFQDLLCLPAEDITLKSLTAKVATVTKERRLTLTDMFKLSKSKGITELLAAAASFKGSCTSSMEVIPIYEGVGLEAWGLFEDTTTVYNMKISEIVDQPCWTRWVIELCALAVLGKKESATILHPFQEGFTTTLKVSQWPTRQSFLETLESFGGCSHGRKEDEPVADGKSLMLKYEIGTHLSRDGRSIGKTIRECGAAQAYQIFISAPMSARATFKDADMVDAAAAIAASKSRIFVHSPYVINLAATPGEKDDYGVICLEETVKAAIRMGMAGVVVHVGKSVKLAQEVAIENMRTNLRRAVEAATVACPILLETPAGQGTELLTDWGQFFGFVRDFADPRLQVCIDTCHVFAAGADPAEYLERAVRDMAGVVRLVHFNDSKGALGSCVDRHAPPGEGEIGLATMAKIAAVAAAAGIPCIYE